MKSLSRAVWIPALIVAVLVLAGGAWWSMAGSTKSGGLGIGGPFSLTSGAGRTVTDRDLRGKFLLVYFGYTFCPDVCPTTLTQVAGALDRLGKRGDRVQPVFITVDPQRDTPQVVADYAAAFSPRILGLTGTPEQIAAVTRAYRVYYAAGKPDGSGSYSVDHSSILYLMGPDGDFIAPIRADAPAEQMATDIAKHLE